MIRRKMMKRTFLVGPVLAALIGAGVVLGCTNDTGIVDDRDSGNGAVATQEISEPGGSESGGEHAPGGEGAGGESGGEGRASGSEEASGATLALDETFDAVRGGARLVLNYDAPSNSFTGTAENTTSNVLSNVRIEVHLSNGTELGPTTPVDLAPGQVMDVNLRSTAASFTGWIAHAEVGSGVEGGQVGGEGGESGPDGPEGAESGGAGNEAAMEAAMSSPIIPLDQTWNGVLGGLAISANYDAATQSVNSTVQNTTSQTLCYVQAEPHLKSGTQTVGELGPDVLGDLNPGQQATAGVSVASKPCLAGVAFDGYVVHMEVFDCGGPGPVPHTGGLKGKSGILAKLLQWRAAPQRARKSVPKGVRRAGGNWRLTRKTSTTAGVGNGAASSTGRPNIERGTTTGGRSSPAGGPTATTCTRPAIPNLR